MKCPKCSYLGFETGDRCRNCGYDFSLMAPPDTAVHDLSLRPPAEDAAHPLPSLPLFSQARVADDEPLIKVAPAPRAPLAVRRTPETPRLRSSSRPGRRPEPEPALQFPDEPVDLVEEQAPARAVPVRRSTVKSSAAAAAAAAMLPRRIGAAAIDLTILVAIDLGVVYFTLRMAGLTMGDWPLLPPVPMLAFLAMVKLAYFCAFTSLGGQTIGKMAMRIQVVADDQSAVDAARAIRRVAIGVLSALTLGLAFIPALIGPDRRALHDRFARTRVVARTS